MPPRLVLLLAVLGSVGSSISTPFDGRYINPTPQDRSVEWWWGSATGTPANPDGIPPAIQFLFNDGYAMLFGPRNTSTPQYWVDVKGFHLDGTPIDLIIPAENGTVVSHPSSPQAVVGTWGSIAQFRLSPDMRTFTVTFSTPQITGKIVMKSDARHHYACNNTQSPYLETAITDSAALTESESVLFGQTGWAVTLPGGTAYVDLVINGKPLKFNGYAYHDQNWTPQALTDFVDAWYFGSGQFGGYTFSFASASTLGGTHTLNTGYLSHNGVVLQNQCGVVGQKTQDISIIRPFGQVNESGIITPAGYNVTYVLPVDNGERVTFQFTPLAENPARSVYHRYVARVVGGIEGDAESQAEGWALIEWLNPSIRTVYPQLHP